MDTDTLALFGGTPACQVQLPAWPIFGEPERRRLLSVLDSGNWFSGMVGGDEGTQTAEFEKEFHHFQGLGFGAAVTNGTAALEVSLRAAGIEQDDEVIVPAYTFIATASAVSQLGAIPVIVDIDEHDLCISPERILEAVTPKTKAIIPVHFGGQIADMERICEIAKENHLVVVEDCAHALGSVRFGKPAGSFGLAGAFSFQHSKNISGGEGGMIGTNDRTLHDLCVSLRSCGRKPKAPAYEHFLIGWNYRMTEWQAAVLLCQIARAKEQRDIRENSAEYLRKELAGNEGFVVQQLAKETTHHSYYYFVVKLKDDSRDLLPSKDRVIEAIRAEGIPAVGGYPWPINNNPVFQKVPVRIHPTQVSEKMCKRVIVLPHYLLLSGVEGLDAIIGALQKVSRHFDEII